MLRVLLTGTASDAHTWNLSVAGEVIVEEGHQLQLLGAPAPPETVIEAAHRYRPDLIVVGTINGHGAMDALKLIRLLRARGLRVPVVIGGRLTTLLEDDTDAAEGLRAAGYEAVFTGPRALEAFCKYLAMVTLRLQAVG
jgi:methylaspartate mutase sigma subunit